MGGYLKCEKHKGGNGHHYRCCKHIFDEWQQGIYNAVVHHNSFERLHYCESCYELSNLHRYQNIKLDDIMAMSESEYEALELQYDAGPNQIQRCAYCYYCFLEDILNWARKNGHNDPFEVFDNTLDTHEKTDELRNYLEANYKFQPVDPFYGGWSSLLFDAGNIETPFTITIYHVIDESEQKHILELIDHFFEHIPQKQRLVRFYKALLVYRTRNGGSHASDQEVLLAEYLTK